MLSFISKLKPKINIVCGLFLLMTAYATVFSILSILKHHTFQTTAWDLGIYEQVLWSTVNSDRLFWYSVELPVNPSGSFFGIHFSPILFLFLPVYGIFQMTETLLILQSVFMALGALPLYLIIKDETNKKTALAFACVYLLYPPLHGMNLFDFHVQAFLPFFLLFAFYYFKRQKWVPYFTFTILALMTVEFVPFIVIFMGLYGLWTCHKDLAKIRRIGIVKMFSNRRFIASILTVVVALAWFMMARSVLFYYNPSPRPHPNWKEFGDPVYGLPGLIFSFVSNPLRTIQTLFTPFNEKMYYIIVLFAPIGFLSFLSPPSLLIGAPWFLAALLSNYPVYFSPVGYQYVGFVIPFVFISAFYGSKRLVKAIYVLRDGKGNFKKLKISYDAIISKMFLGMILLSLISLSLLSKGLMLPRITYRDQILENLTRFIPSNASVLTQNDIFPHLSRRIYSYVGNNPVGNFSNTNFDYIFVDTTSSWYVGESEFSQLPLETFVPKVLESGEYGLITAVDGIWILKKSFNGTPTFPVEKGVFGKFYSDPNSTGKPEFESVFLDTQWDWTWQPPFPTTKNSTWSAIFSSYLYISTTGTYQFQVTVSGVCKLYIDDILVLDLTETGFQTTDEDLLRQGMHSIRIEYTKTTDPGTLKIRWRTPFRESSETISYDNLFWNTSSYGE